MLFHCAHALPWCQQCLCNVSPQDFRQRCHAVRAVMLCLTACTCACSPEMHGETPPFRFRHTTNLVVPQPGSLLFRRVAARLEALKGESSAASQPPAASHWKQAAAAPDGKDNVAGTQNSGHLLLMWGGYNTRGGEFGGSELEVCVDCALVECISINQANCQLPAGMYT